MLNTRTASPLRQSGHTANVGKPNGDLRTNVDLEGCRPCIGDIENWRHCRALASDASIGAVRAKSVWGDGDIPEILYKYIPRKLICTGVPQSLRATQLLALNDDMECNVTTMKSREQEDTLDFLATVRSKLEGHLGIAVPWEELLTRSLHYGDLRLSTFIQEYLNPLVGVVSFSTDILVPTMWAHYARNTGIVVGYCTEALSALGFELRPVVYSELAPHLPSREKRTQSG